MRKFFTGKPCLVSNGGSLPGVPYYTAHALDRAVEYGADAIYLVLRSTKDGKLIASPEKDLSVMTDIKGLISEQDFHESAETIAQAFRPRKEIFFSLQERG
jgi:glycerophosphoryl diester phosphodiesterase